MKRILLSSALLFSASSYATNGYFMHGASIQAQGMAGASTALALDSVQATANPAALTQLNNQLDLGINLFQPSRKATIAGNGAGANGTYSGDGKSQFIIPQIGAVLPLSEDLSLGLAAYGNGGMNTTYKQNPFAAFGSSGTAGVDLSQLYLVASLGYKVSEGQRLGIGLTHVYQRFAAKGIQGFAGMSSAPTNVSNNGYDSGNGWGVKLSWQGDITDSITLGANWNSKVSMNKFSKYKGLFAEEGGFDIPSSFSAGIAVKATPQLTVAADWERINYGSIKSIANPLTLTAPLGTTNGSGFGWKTINVLKLGAIYQVDDQFSLSAGISHADQPISQNQTFFNILAPGVVQDHISLGGTWTLNQNSAVSVAYTHALNNRVRGSGSIPTRFGGGESNIEMNQNTLGVSWKYNF